jgi:hypothetical protein
MICAMKRREFLKRSAVQASALAAASWPIGAAVPGTTPVQILLWCWDARMTWDDQQDAITHQMAVTGKPFPYPKKPESFLVGFKRLVDYAARIGVRGIIIWGFLRDSHGGIKAAVELCRYATDRGVAILPGVGLCSYGGYYFEGDHPFNLDTYLRKYPDRISQARHDRDGHEVAPVLDPALPANQQWWREGLEWMLETFKIGGLDFEMGDFIVNPSPLATAARKDLGFSCDENIMDAVVATKDLMRRSLEVLPDGIFLNCTYRGYEEITGFPNMPYLQALPEQTIWQYALRGTIVLEDFENRFKAAPGHRQYGCLHWFNASTKTLQTDYVPEIVRIWPSLHRLGFEFLGTYGELSAINNPLADRNYRAQVAWARNPALALDDFNKGKLA